MRPNVAPGLDEFSRVDPGTASDCSDLPVTAVVVS